MEAFSWYLSQRWRFWTDPHWFGGFKMSSKEGYFPRLWSITGLLELLRGLDVPLKITENSKPVPLGDFLKKFVNTKNQKWEFNAIIYFRLGKTQVHITESELCCDNECKLSTGDTARLMKSPQNSHDSPDSHTTWSGGSNTMSHLRLKGPAFT